MEKIDMKSVLNKTQKAVQVVKNKVENLKKSTQNNEIKMKINNKEAEKQITQLEKEINSLQSKINSRQMKLDIINPQMDKIVNDTRNQVVPDGISKNDSSMDAVVNNALSSNKDFTSLDSQAQKLYTEIEMYNKQLNEAKLKMSQLKQETNQTAITQSKLSSFFSSFKQKLDQTKPSVNGIKNSFNQIPKITQNITNSIGKMNTKMKGGLKHILKYAGALFSLRSIYSALSSSASSWLSSQNAQAQQLSANIEYMKYSMGSALAPIIEYIINLIYKLMKAIQSVVYAFSGVNIFAKATASSMNKASNSANKASKSLSGVHSEINNVSEKDNSSGTGATSPSMDLTKVDTSMNAWIEKIKSKLYTLFEPIQNSWNRYGQPLIESMKYSFNSNLQLIKTIGKSFEEVWLNGTGEHTVSTILQILISIFNICGNISIAFKKAWENSGGTEIIQNIWNGLNNILGIILGVQQAYEEWTAGESFQEFANSIIEICVTLSGWFELITQKLGEIWENGGKQAFTSLLEFISKLITAISSILKFLSPVIEFVINTVTPVISGIIETIGYVIDALSGILDFIIGVFTGDWERAWEGIKEFFIGIWNALSTIVSTVLKTIWSVISTVFNTIKTFIVNVWNGIVNTISNVWKTIVNKVKEGVSGAWNAITSVFSKISGWFKEQFTKAWQAVKNVFSTGGKIFDGIKDGIVTTFKSVVNAIINGINKVISIPFNAINGVLNGIRNINILGVQPFTWVGTISVPQIPQLAKGNVAYGPLVAMFGEYSGASNNPEITTPQNIMRETFEDVLASQEWNNNSDKPIRVQIYWGTKAVVDEIIDGINQKTRQTGKAQIKVAYDY